MVTRKSKPSSDGTGRAARKPMSLKKLAEYLELSPATVSLVINRSTVADSIPQDTKDRIFAAVRKFKYRPNFFARSLRTKPKDSFNGLLLSETALAKDWNTPEEDAAWASL